MCGIAGAVAADPVVARAETEAMCAQMIARGPDDGGTVAFAARSRHIALGNRRLAIIDPTPHGHQPMGDERGNAIVFNGMIYNYRELRAELVAAGERFTSDCDTEVLLRAYGRWGPACVTRLRGMFAFAIYDARDGALFLARDRFGIKPLYYWHAGERFLFASQVRALLETETVPFRLDPAAIASYLAFGAVSEPRTIVVGISALPPAHTATLRGSELRIERYWSMPDEVDHGRARPELVRELRSKLEESVASHLISDAPAGVFLSGGLDSSALAALAARGSDRVRTISVVFADPAFSEAPHMEAVARHIGSEHTAVHLRPGDLRAALPGAFAAMDQPSFDGVNTYIVARAAAEAGLKVALSGLGADELLDGYGHTRRIAALQRFRRLPPFASRAGAMLLRGTNEQKLDAWLSGRGGDSAYALLRRLFLPDEVAVMVRAESGDEGDPLVTGRFGDLSQRTSLLDLQHYTKNVLLRDTDAMSMAHGLEVRVPFLDDALAGWALRLPGGVKGAGKRLLADATRDLLPPEIAARRKRGFVLPLARWLRDDLRDDATATLASLPPALAPHLDATAVREIWREYAAGSGTWLRPWALVALCRWVESAAVTSAAKVAA